jgi:hypothetical protein
MADVSSRRVVIAERPDGWEIEGRSYGTAAEALRSVRDEDAASVLASDVSAVTVIEWRPTSRVGRLVVESLSR